MPIDHARARSNGPRLKSALTRAINSGEPEKVAEACREALLEWRQWGLWPDHWHRWDAALSDAHRQSLRAGQEPGFPADLEALEELLP